MDKRILDFKLRARPINLSNVGVDANGDLADLKIRAVEGEERVIKGYLCVWNLIDRHKTIWVRGCFAKSIRERGVDSGAKQKIILLWMHKQDDPIGQFRSLIEDDYGLYFEAVLDDVPSAIRAITQINSGTINQFSFGFDYIWDKVEWDENLDGLRILEAELFEGSVVSFGSQKETFAIRSIQDLENEKQLADDDLDDFLKSVPKARRLELRSIITRQISLAAIKPDDLLENPLKKDVEPEQGSFNFRALNQIFTN
jgi:HK97 family phage prohead protease